MSILPPQISFRDFEPSAGLRAFVEDQVAKLDRFYPAVMGCRVMLEVPHRRHREGNLYHVRIDCTVPGRELVVSRNPAEDEARADPYVAVVDAFDAMCRQLEDYARVARRQVKAHEVAPHGRIARLEPDEEHGFIETPDGREVYFHAHSVLGARFRDLQVGAEVRFTEEEGVEGPQASTVRPIGKHHLLSQGF
jgi:cold shock CspA family protein/ribosome-associated translation inhibitor RaiA